ncbi:MAG TPA: PTS sugar transporter subunit IIB, partial [Erysipelothrix sp.]|nr:PTS sugar transporter subunit IIB [Erysipelothrix sp.]
MGKIVLARIDERLVHGQVMTNLSKSAGANAIFIVDDQTAKDEFMKTIFISSGSRTGLSVKVLSVEDAINYWNNEQFENFRVILLTKTIDVVDQLVQGGLEFDSLNVGGIAKKPGTEYVIKAVGINAEQASVLKRLNEEHGIEVYFQAVP